MDYKDLSPATNSEEQLRLLIAENRELGQEKLAAERTLGNEIGVSRTTLRRSLDALEKEGQLKKSERKGIKINVKQPINMLSMNSMTNQLNKTSQKLSITVLKNKIVKGPKAANLFLQLEEDSQLFMLSRKRLIDGRPFMYEISYLNPARFLSIETTDFTDRSLYEYLQAKYAVFPTYGREEIRAVLATTAQAEILAITERTPLFKVISKAYDQEDDPIEYSIQYLIGDQVAYNICAQNIFDYREEEEGQ